MNRILHSYLTAVNTSNFDTETTEKKFELRTMFCIFSWNVLKLYWNYMKDALRHMLTCDSSYLIENLHLENSVENDKRMTET